MVKRADRLAKVMERAARREQSVHKEAAMQAFLDECQRCMTPQDWEKHFAEVTSGAGNTFHLVEYMVSLLAAKQLPITPSLRRSIDAMLDALKWGRSSWKELEDLNYGDYWKAQYGYK
jgi:hypothetical protein